MASPRVQSSITSPFQLPIQKAKAKANEQREQVEKAKQIQEMPPQARISIDGRHIDLPDQATSQVEGIQRRVASTPEVGRLAHQLGSELLSSDNLTEKQIGEIVDRATAPAGGSSSSTRLTEEERARIIQDVHVALEQSKEEFQQLRAHVSTAPDHLPSVKNNQEMLAQGDPLHRACKAGLVALEQSARVIKMHTEETEKRTRIQRDLLDLSNFITRYEELEELDLAEPGEKVIPEEAERALAWLETARQNGVVIEGNGWSTPKEREALKRGVTAVIGWLQGQNKVKDLQLQQVMQVYSALVVLITTMIVQAGRLGMEISRNMRQS